MGMSGPCGCGSSRKPVSCSEEPAACGEGPAPTIRFSATVAGYLPVRQLMLSLTVC